MIIVSTNGEELVIGCAVINMFENNGCLLTGYQEIAVWPFYCFDSIMTGMDPFLGSLDHLPHEQVCKIVVQFDSYSKDVFYSIRDKDMMALLQFPSAEEKKEKDKDKPLTTEELVVVNSVLTRDPVDPPMTNNEKTLMVKARDYLREVPNTLTYYLMAIKW